MEQFDGSVEESSKVSCEVQADRRIMDGQMAE